MITNSRDVGRPRSFEDDAIFKATSTVLARDGHSRLTLAAVAEQLGCTPPALSKRFGSKRGLLLGFAAWSRRLTEERICRVAASPGAPLDLLAGFILGTVSGQAAEWSGAPGLANLLVFNIETAMDPEFRVIWLEHTLLYEEAFARWLRDAQTAGDLEPACDISVLARALLAGFTGAAVRWTAESQASVEARYREVIEAIIGPCRRSKS
jgi:AcrR family transcriptional regulator